MLAHCVPLPHTLSTLRVKHKQTQELPALLVPLCVLAWHQPNTSVLSTLQHITRPCNALAISFLFHYSYRSLIYPLRMRGPKRTALVVWAMATAFCCWNGYIQVGLSVSRATVANTANFLPHSLPCPAHTPSQSFSCPAQTPTSMYTLRAGSCSTSVQPQWALCGRCTTWWDWPCG